MLIVAGIAIGLVLGAALLALGLRMSGRSGLSEAARRRDEMIAGAKREADNLRRESEIASREEAMRLKGEAEQALQERRGQMAKLEERVLARQDELEAKLTELLRREQGLADREIHIKELQQQLKDAKDEEEKELERISGLTVNEARAQLLERSEQMIRHDLARRLRQLEDRIPDGPLNNARVLNQRRYGRYEEFRKRFEAANGEWDAFFRSIDADSAAP